MISKYENQWVFIIGCNNSGTTLLQRIIESHPMVIGIEGEGQYRTQEFVTDREIKLNRLFSERLDIFREIPEVDALKVKYDWLVSILRRKSKAHRYILEKTTVNSVRLPWLFKNFPNAKFIIIFREAFAVVEGMNRKENIDIQRAAIHWKTTNELIIKDSNMIKNIIYLKYEDLASDPEGTIPTIWNFLELSAGPNETKNNSRTYNIHGKSSKISNQNPKSLDRLSKQDLANITDITLKIQSRIDELSIKD